jgi:hypothetical protein
MKKLIVRKSNESARDASRSKFGIPNIITTLREEGAIHWPESFKIDVFKGKTLRDIQRKDGTNTIPAGTNVFVFQSGKSYKNGLVLNPITQEYVNINWCLMYKTVTGFDPAPNMDELEEMAMDSMSTTPSGDDPVEHDGWDSYGFWSWVRILIGV